ncbi:unnamed protein product, partial [Ixodes hexagonus]
MPGPRESDSAARHRRGVEESGFLSSLARSQVPGLKVACDMSQPRLRRAYWLAALAVFLALTLRDIYRTAEDFLRRPVVMTVEMSTLRQGPLTLPAITVCNLNQVRRSVLCGDRAVWADIAGAAHWRDTLCGEQRTRGVWLSPEQLSEASNFTAWVMETQRANESLGMLMGHQREDLIRECSLGARSACRG